MGTQQLRQDRTFHARIRTRPDRPGNFNQKEIVNFAGWRNFLIVSVCLAFSAFYELIEWWAAELIGEDADAFLGNARIRWDTQSDMAFALLGAISCLLTIAKFHDRQIKES